MIFVLLQTYIFSYIITLQRKIDHFDNIIHVGKKSFKMHNSLQIIYFIAKKIYIAIFFSVFPSAALSSFHCNNILRKAEDGFIRVWMPQKSPFCMQCYKVTELLFISCSSFFFVSCENFRRSLKSIFVHYNSNSSWNTNFQSLFNIANASEISGEKSFYAGALV